MSTLHVFNPEHDIALASNLANFTAPHAGRQLRADLGFLPALWAAEGDVVMVDNEEYAEKAWKRLCRRMACLGQTGTLLGVKSRFTRSKVPVYSEQTSALDVWGWDKALKAVLLRRGVSETLMPSDAQLEEIRQLSHRRVAAGLLPQLRMAGTVGEAFECREAAEVQQLLDKYGQVVLKMPWSSSGRGVRFVSNQHSQVTIQNWLRNVIERQGSVMVEPYYNKVKDFGMEFSADGEGRIRYEGLSLFHTLNGAYTGNILATERAKQEIISCYIPVDLLDEVKQRISTLADLGSYRGPFGVDMMVVRADKGFLLHPCVEINLRRTMGHVALTLSPTDDDIRRVMRIEYDGNHYKLKINKLR